MINKQFDTIILDADICLKLGGYDGIQVLEKIIPLVSKKAYIHKYVYNEELLIPAKVKKQLKKLIEKEQLVKIDEDDLEAVERMMYESNVQILCKAMKGTEQLVDSEHKGEIISLAMAKVLDIPIFMSDEKDLQPIIDLKLNTGIGSKINVFRLQHVITWIKNNPNCEVTRKDARKIWCGAYDKKKIDFYKDRFNQELWPL